MKYSFKATVVLYVLAVILAFIPNTVQAQDNVLDLGPWQQTTSLDDARVDLSGAVYGNYIFVTGGETGIPVHTDVFSAKISADGNLQSWETTTPIPARTAHATIASRGYLFVIGGYRRPFDPGGGQSTVFSAPILENGQVGDWLPTESLPTDLYRHSVVSYGDWLYVIGGWSDERGTAQRTVYRGFVNSNGKIDEWISLESLPVDLHSHAAVVANNYIVVIGGGSGLDSSTIRRSVYFSPINEANGSIGQWIQGEDIPTPLAEMGVVISGDTLISIGGVSGDTGNATDKVFVTTISNDGMLNHWYPQASLPRPISHSASVVAKENIYVIGGTGGGVRYSDVIRSAIEGEKSLGEKAAELAKTIIGAPYLWEAKGWDFKTHTWLEPADIFSDYHWSWRNTEDLGKGLDCSGLVWWTYNKAFGATKFKLSQFEDNPSDALWYYEGATGMFFHNTDPISEADLKPGDLLFFSIIKPGTPHVAMYVGPHVEGDVIHASTNNDATVQWDTVDNMKEKETFDIDGFRRIKVADVNMSARVFSPVNLLVTDPDGNTITADTQIITPEETLREVADTLYYSEYDIDGDGELDGEVYSPHLKVGDYLIKVEPKPDALPSDTYSLEIEAAGTTITLAQDVLVSDIPSQGYGISSTGAEINEFFPIAIDIKPGSEPNCINSNGHGAIPVAIMSDASFDATQIDPLTIGLDGQSVRVAGKKGIVQAHKEDINNDNLIDLVVQIEDTDGVYEEGETTAILTAETYDSTPVRGRDSICIVP